VKRGDPQAQFNRSATLFPWAVLLVSLAVTIVATLIVSRLVQKKDDAAFKAESQRTQDQVSNRISSMAALLKGVKGMFYQEHDAGPKEFKNFVEGVDFEHHLIGMRGVGYILNLSGAGSDTLQERLHKDDIKGFVEHPAGVAPELPILYLEPAKDHHALLGLNVSANPQLFEATQRVAPTGRMSISGLVSLTEDPILANKPTVVMFVPVYYGNDEIQSDEDRQSHLIGFVFAPIVTSDLVGPTLNGTVTCKVYVDVDTARHLIYNSPSVQNLPAAYKPRYRDSFPRQVDDQKLAFVFETTPAFDASSDRWLIPMTLIVGSMVSFLLFLFTHLEATARKRAQQEADDRKLAQRELAMSERRLRNLIEQSPLSIQVISPAGETIEVNSGFEKQWGMSLSDLADVNFFEHPYMKECGLLPYLTRAVSGKPTLLPVTQFDPSKIAGSGRVRWMAGSAYPLKDDQGRVREIVLIHQDFTDIKQKEEEIQRINSYLEQRVEERTEELAGAMSEMEAFSYSVAHDLRAPLRAMASFARILLEDYSEKLDHEAQSFLSRIVENSIRMGELIDGLLDLSRISRATLEKNEVNLSAMAEEIVRSMEKRQPTPWARTLVHPDLRVEADVRLIHSALQNLLDNAWKFSQKSKDPLIEFGAEERDGERIFFVRDNGAGFDPSYTAKLFKPFERLHTGSEFPGTGIGLATVRRIIERHGGRVWAEGKLGGGATFHFTLPPGAMRTSPPLDLSEEFDFADSTISASRGHLT
jgi:PAS domain S-box-containing protein